MHFPNSDPFAGFWTVGLEELNAQAALQTRVDRKYLLTRLDLMGLFDGLESTLRVLEIDDRRSFGYESTYFDTPTFDSYLDAARSRPSRFKVRTRTYLDSDLHFVEVKTRSRGGDTIKTRRSATADDHHLMTPASRAFVTETLTHELPAHCVLGSEAMVSTLQPVVRTRYERATLLVDASPAERDSIAAPSRTTIDTALGFGAPGETSRVHQNVVIVETKSPGAPSPIDRVLWRAGHRPTKISKYGTGLALEHPHLPAAKWNRVLRRHFAWKPQRS